MSEEWRVGAGRAAEDDELLHLYANEGSEEAFGRIVRRYTPLVYGVCLRELRSREQAEDAAQTVFLVLAQKAGSIGSGRALCAWLFSTSRLTAMRVGRDDRRRRARETACVMESTEATRSGEWDDVLWSRIEPDLDDALQSLGRADREFVLLHYFQGWTLREVGTAFAISEEAARKRVSRAVEKMRRFLQRRGAEAAPEALAGLLAGYRMHGQPHAPILKALARPTITPYPGIARLRHVSFPMKGVSWIRADVKLKLVIASACAAGLLVGGGWWAETRAFRPAAAQIAETRRGYEFHVKYTAGQRLRYITTGTSTSPQAGATATTSMPAVYHVLSVEKGVATIEITYGPVQLNGKAMGAAQTAIVRVDGQGRTTGDNPLLKSMGDLGPMLPPHPLRIGESYGFGKRLPMPAAGDVTMTLKYTLREIKVVQGIRPR